MDVDVGVGVIGFATVVVVQIPPTKLIVLVGHRQLSVTGFWPDAQVCGVIGFATVEVVQIPPTRLIVLDGHRQLSVAGF